jgi:hypothetical protein
MSSENCTITSTSNPVVGSWVTVRTQDGVTKYGVYTGDGNVSV